MTTRRRRPGVGGGGSAEVVSIGARGSHRADFKQRACELVAVARDKLGQDTTQFAAHLQEELGRNVTPGIVERWESGNTPPGDVLLACAVAAQVMPGDATADRAAALLAQIAPADDEIGEPQAVLPYASRESVARQQWRDIISGSQDYLWLSGMAEYQYAIDDDVPLILAEATARGCEVRVLLLSPHYPDMASISTREGNPPDALPARIRAALHRFSSMRADIGPAMKIRTYSTHPAISIVRGDDRLLVTPYLPYTIGSNCPTFELTRGSAAKMFGRYEATFQKMWQTAKDWTP